MKQLPDHLWLSCLEPFLEVLFELSWAVLDASRAAWRQFSVGALLDRRLSHQEEEQDDEEKEGRGGAGGRVGGGRGAGKEGQQ